MKFPHKSIQLNAYETSGTSPPPIESIAVAKKKLVPNTVPEVRAPRLDNNSSCISTSRKTCSDCDVEKPFDQFHKKGKRHESRCKSCVSKFKANRYKAKKKEAEKKRRKRFGTKMLNITDCQFSETLVPFQHDTAKKVIRDLVEAILCK